MARPRKIVEGQESEPNLEMEKNESVPVSPMPQIDPRDAKIEALETSLNEVKELLRERNSAKPPKKPIKHTANVMFVEDLPVIEFGKVRKVGDVLSVKLIVLKEDMVTTEPREMDYLEAVNHNRRYLVEILDMKKEKETFGQGPIPMRVAAKMSDEVNKRTADGNPFSPRMIDLEYIKESILAKIRFVEGPWEGKELEVDADLCLNK